MERERSERIDDIGGECRSGYNVSVGCVLSVSRVRGLLTTTQSCHGTHARSRARAAARLPAEHAAWAPTAAQPPAIK